jgi:uncharacterized protein YqgQ
MKLIIKIFRILFIIILFIKPLSANITEDLLKLSEMYNKGILTSEEFTKAKSILLQIEEIESSEKSKSNELSKDQKKKPKIAKKEVNKKKQSTDNVKIERIFTTVGSKFTNKSFEKMKLTVGDFIIYTHRPGAVKIKKRSNNKQYAVIGDNLEVKFYNKGQDFLDINVDKENKELILKINNSKILIWKGQYVQKAEATFYQILALGRLPFHFYIKLDVANNAAALNMEKFNRSIELAVNAKKKDLSSQYNITIAQIDEIIEQNDMLAAYGEIIPTNNVYDTTDQKKLSLYSDLKQSIGVENYKTLNKSLNSNLNNDLNKAVDDQVQVAIDESIRDAINSGIESAALDAGIAALIDALMSGASWAEALSAGQNACGC